MEKMVHTKRLSVVSAVILALAAAMAVMMIVLQPGQFDAEIRKTVATLEGELEPDTTRKLTDDGIVAADEVAVEIVDKGLYTHAIVVAEGEVA